MVQSPHVDDGIAAELLADLQTELENADTIAETPLSEHFHETRTNSVTDTAHVVAIIRHTDDGDRINVEVRKYNDIETPNASRLPHDCIGTVEMKPEPLMEIEDYRGSTTRMVEDDRMLMGAI